MAIYGSIINESQKMNKKLYFVSSSSMDGVVLHPLVPNNYFTQNGYEDNKTPRICFAPSIGQCLMGLSQNLAGKEFYVHIIDPDIDERKLKSRIYYPTVKEVPDCKITGEVWILRPTQVYLDSKIKVIKDSGKPGHKFKYGDGKEAELYDWDWEYIIKYNE